MLRGHGLSRVQAAAAEYALILQMRTEARSFDRDFRLAVVAHDPAKTPILFPEWFPEGTATEDDLDDEEAEIAWEMPEFDPREAEGVLASLRGTQSIGLDEVDEVLGDIGWDPWDDEDEPTDQPEC